MERELSLRAAITEPFNSEIIWAYAPEWTGDLQNWCQPGGVLIIQRYSITQKITCPNT